MVNLSKLFIFLLLGMLLSQLSAVNILAKIAPDNEISIPNTNSIYSDALKEKYSNIFFNIQKIYSEEVANYDASLVFKFDWENPKVNAFANRSWNDWNITVYGGLVRHPLMTESAFALVTCHELGHHIGGAPKKELLYASSESQADYWANQSCLRKYFKTYFSAEQILEMTNRIHLPATLRKCENVYSNEIEKSLCVILVNAGLEISNFLNSLRKVPKEISLKTPDLKRVVRTNVDYAPIQCRLDTFTEAALCPMTIENNIDQRDEVSSGCMEQNGWFNGYRPSCWYKPFSVIPH